MKNTFSKIPNSLSTRYRPSIMDIVTAFIEQIFRHSCPLDSLCKVNSGSFGSGRSNSLHSIETASVIVGLSLGRSWTQRSETCMHLKPSDTQDDPPNA